jgi:phage anti-repressor protein
MNITTSPTKIGDEVVQTVKARDLHANLNIRKDFSDWVKAQIKRAGLTENEDYCYVNGSEEPAANGVYPQKVEGATDLGGRPSVEYYFTIDAAKHIALMSNTPRGREVRKYFIAVEKAYREGVISQELAQAQTKLLVDFERTKQDTIVDFLRSIDITYFGRRDTVTPERKYFALLEFDHLKLHATAFKYRIPIAQLQDWVAESTQASMEALAEVVKRQYPAEAIRWDMEYPSRKALENAQALQLSAASAKTATQDDLRNARELKRVLREQKEWAKREKAIAKKLEAKPTTI